MTVVARSFSIRDRRASAERAAAAAAWWRASRPGRASVLQKVHNEEKVRASEFETLTRARFKAALGGMCKNWEDKCKHGRKN